VVINFGETCGVAVDVYRYASVVPVNPVVVLCGGLMVLLVRHVDILLRELRLMKPG
jgi:hypothetical protein